MASLRSPFRGTLPNYKNTEIKNIILRFVREEMGKWGNKNRRMSRVRGHNKSQMDPSAEKANKLNAIGFTMTARLIGDKIVLKSRNRAKSGVGVKNARDHHAVGKWHIRTKS